MLRRFFQVLIVVPAFVALLVAIGAVQGKLNDIRVQEKLVDTEIIANAPPVVAFTTVALGAFRGLVADLLWLRATALQDKGQYFEMVQLASWITKLQPRFTGAIAYLAWNMSYNISVTFSAPEDRWRWVQRGLELIRDEALEYNPGDALLYKELGWIYQHKIGNIMDDANLYYKNQMAVQMMRIFDGPEPNWAAFLAAARTQDELLRHYPADDPLWTAIRDTGFASFNELEQRFRADAAIPADLRSRLPKHDLRPLEMCLRARWLRQVCKLRPEKILELNNRYGKLDWRLPEAHAIYWASLGIDNDRAGGIKIECERMITQSLKDAFLGGRLLMADPKQYSQLMLGPNLNVIDAARQSYLDAWRRQQSNSFRDGLKNFMKDAIVTLYTYGRYTEARRQLTAMQDEFPEDPQWRQDLDRFVLKEWIEDAKEATPRQAMAIIDGLVFQSCVHLAYGEHETAVAHERLAGRVYRIYYKSQEASWARTGLPPFDEIKQRRTELCLKNFPPELANPLRKQLQAIQAEKEKDNPDAPKTILPPPSEPARPPLPPSPPIIES
jgi:hypothetical protein